MAHKGWSLMMYEAIGTQTEGVKTFLLKHANHPGHVKTEKITVFFHLSINTKPFLMKYHYQPCLQSEPTNPQMPHQLNVAVLTLLLHRRKPYANTRRTILSCLNQLYNTLLLKSFLFPLVEAPSAISYLILTNGSQSLHTIKMNAVIVHLC